MAGERLRDVLEKYRRRYGKANRKERSRLLNEFCGMSGYHRKYAISLLNAPVETTPGEPRRRRGVSYSISALKVIEAVWAAAGYPWSRRLKALLPLWLPWARERVGPIRPETQRQILAISPRQLDRRLASRKRRLKRRLYGKTKPGTLLKHQIPIHAGPWRVTEPGYAEVDLVSHSGPAASGEFAYTLNLTDIHTGWCESRALLGRGQKAVVDAIEAIRLALPFPLRALDSDNGSEFINAHLLRYCRDRQIALTRSRPYQKDDNAHVEQKNWTHVRKLLGWDRYDSPRAVEAINRLYARDLAAMMNLFQPSVKLLERARVGSRLRRRYDAPLTPLDRLRNAYDPSRLPGEVRLLIAARDRTDPFDLAEAIDRQLLDIQTLRADARSPFPRASLERRAGPLSPQGAVLPTSFSRR